jgi:hypothetical protein
MAAYGKGQMLGSGINPESFKLDFGGFADAARMQAQGIAGLGQSIGGAIQNYGEAKKEQRKVDAYNKASAKSIEAAITLGKSYGITAAEETLAPFLKSYNDPNLSPIEKAALLDEGKAMIPNVFGRFDKDQAMAIQNAQNAPPPAPSFGFTGTELKKTDRGDIYVLKGNDGRDYDPETKLPISNLGNFGKGLPPEDWSDGATSAADFINGALNIPFPIVDGSPGSLPPVGDVNPLLPPLTPEDAAAINAIMAGGQLAPPVGAPPASIARPQPAPQYTPRYIATDEIKAPTGTVITMDEYNAAVKSGQNIEGIPLPDGKFYATRQRPFAPQQGQEIITNDGTTIRSITLDGQGGLNKAPTTQIKEGEAIVPDATSPTGTRIVQIPSDAKEKAKTDFSGYMQQITGSYATLDAKGKAVTGEKSSIMNALTATSAGQAVSRALGSEDQVLRDQINTMRPSIVNVIRQATEMGAKGMDSEKELTFYLSAIGDPSLPVEANIKALETLDKVYGTGKAVNEMLKNFPNLKKKVDKYSFKSIPTSETPYTGLDDETKQALKDLGIDE